MTLTNQRSTAIFGSNLAFAGNNGREDLKLVARLRDKILARLDPLLDISNPRLVRESIEAIFPQVLSEENAAITRAERVRIFERVVAEILGYGPIEPLLRDDTITEIMVNGPYAIYVERNGKIEKTPLTFENEEHLMRIIERIVTPLGR
ncbi:MAG: CpaF family protein, partial [Chloroflexi bacterium]|nr:CpaF family protein [Chloroflexota bacterium]